MKSIIVNFNKYKPLLNELVTRDVKTKYRRSVLGVLWTLLNPLLMMVVLSVVFSHLFKFDIDNYPLYLPAGQVVFNFFSAATTMDMTRLLIMHRSLRRCMYPNTCLSFQGLFRVPLT